MSFETRGDENFFLYFLPGFTASIKIKNGSQRINILRYFYKQHPIVAILMLREKKINFGLTKN